MFTLLNDANKTIKISQDDEVYIADLVDNLRSIDGVADKTIFAIISECGDISRFRL